MHFNGNFWTMSIAFYLNMCIFYVICKYAYYVLINAGRIGPPRRTSYQRRDIMSVFCAIANNKEGRKFIIVMYGGYLLSLQTFRRENNITLYTQPAVNSEAISVRFFPPWLQQTNNIWMKRQNQFFYCNCWSAF